MKPTITAIAVAVAISGCAVTPRGAGYVPLVDMQGHSEQRFRDVDLPQCQAYARQRIDAAAGALAGAAAGALLMAFVAPRGYRNYAAGRGAGLGGLSGGLAANENQETIVKRCLAGRGYNVLS